MSDIKRKKKKRKEEKEKVTWNYISMVHQIFIYILGLFLLYSSVYLFFLYCSSYIYEYNINREMGQYFRKEGINYAHTMINSTIGGANTFFDL